MKIKPITEEMIIHCNSRDELKELISQLPISYARRHVIITDSLWMWENQYHYIHVNEHGEYENRFRYHELNEPSRNKLVEFSDLLIPDYEQISNEQAIKMDQKYMSDVLSFHQIQDAHTDTWSIRQIAYELYKQNWERIFINKDQMVDTYGDYFAEIMTREPNQAIEDFDSWIQKNGYSTGNIKLRCASFEEFFEEQYKNAGVISPLLKREQLINMYLEDLQELEQEKKDREKSNNKTRSVIITVENHEQERAVLQKLEDEGHLFENGFTKPTYHKQLFDCFEKYPHCPAIIVNKRGFLGIIRNLSQLFELPTWQSKIADYTQITAQTFLNNAKRYPDIKVGDIVKKDDNLYNVIATAKETGTQFVLRGIENKETVVFAKAEEIEKTNQVLPRIYFETINCDGDLRTWSFNSTEEIAKEWWSEHCDLPGYDDPLVTFQITGKSIPSHNFGDLVSFFDLENAKWREKYYVDDREEQDLNI